MGPIVTCVRCPVPHCVDCVGFRKDTCTGCSDGFVVDQKTEKCIPEADKIPCEQRKCGQCDSLYFPFDDCLECDKDNEVCRRLYCSLSPSMQCVMHAFAEMLRVVGRAPPSSLSIEWLQYFARNHNR